MQDFGENTDRDVKHALHDLASKGMQRLLFDIRGNPGGPLDQAIKVANEFLPRGKMIVYTRGRVAELRSGLPRDRRRASSPTSRWSCWRTATARARRRSSPARCRITIARYIVGETTFGKALVQSVYRISGGAGLALTTAHYYTPSGRLIQRPWDASFDEYLSYTLRDQDAEQAAQPERPEAHRRRAVRSTAAAASSRTSASPVRSKASTRRGSAACSERAQRVRELRAEVHAPRATRASRSSRTGRKIVKPNFVVDDAMVADFREQLKADNVKIDEEAFTKDLDVHQGDDPLRDRRRRLRHRRRAAASDRRRSAGAGGADDVRRGAEADASSRKASTKAAVARC